MYLTVDGMISGTGIRDTYESGYLDIKKLGLSSDIQNKILEWLHKYENAHYNDFEDFTQIEELDAEGLEITQIIKSEIPDVKVEYFSAAKTKKIIVP